MEGAGAQTLQVLRYLLPGFVAAWVFFGLTAHYRPDKFERTVQALIFSLFVQVLVAISRWIFELVGRWHSVGPWTDTSELILSAVLAIVLGLVLSWSVNTDAMHKTLRYFRITKQASHPSEWFGAFNDMELYVVLHLEGNRRLIGWPREWPNKSSEGHFVMVDAAWLDDQNDKSELSQHEAILIPATDVHFVEFLKFIEGVQDDPQRTPTKPIK